MEKATRCVMCGSADWEWDPEQGGSRDAYEVIERFCWGCYKKSYMQDSIERRDGVTLELAPTGTVEAARRQVALERAYESGLL